MDNDTKKLKILGAIYIILFLTFISSIVLAVFGFMIPFVVCLSLGLAGMWILHSTITYYRDYGIGKFYIFGYGLLNLWTLGIWGLVVSIKVLANRDY